MTGRLRGLDRQRPTVDRKTDRQTDLQYYLYCTLFSRIQLRAFTAYKAFSTLQSLPGSAFSGGISQDGIFLRKYLEHISDICDIIPFISDFMCTIFM